MTVHLLPVRQQLRLLLLLLWACCLSAEAGERLVLVAPDAPLPRIVSTEDEHDRDAATDLCHYLTRVAGRTLSLSTDIAGNGTVIHVGRTAFADRHIPNIEDLFADGFVIQVIEEDTRRHLVLAGEQRPSSAWAVDQFLTEFCGVRWIWPDPHHGTLVPSRPTLTVPADLARRYEPDYVSRYNSAMAIYTPNRSYLRGKPRFYEYGYHALQHIFSEEVFEANPQWFALFDGKRQWWTYGNGWQICTSNPQTVDHTVEHVLKTLADNPELPVVSVGQNDGAGWCECGPCVEYIHSFDPPYNVSERWFDWVNQVARKVKPHHPDLWIEAMAYSHTSVPPRFALEPNVAITKTIVGTNDFELARQWSEGCRSVNLYSYMYGSPMLSIRHYPRAARDFLKWGRDKLGARAHVNEVSGDWTTEGFKYHYINALQWDVDTDVDALMEDLCRSAYGPAAVSMRRFWDRLEAIYERCDPGERLAFYLWVGWTKIPSVAPNYEFRNYTLADVEFLDASIEEAVELTRGADDPGFPFRVERMRDAWAYYRANALGAMRYGAPMPAVRVSGRQERDAALARAREIAGLRSGRRKGRDRMSTFPALNPKVSDPNYWSPHTGHTFFNHELTLLEQLCSAVTHDLTANGEPGEAEAFWNTVSPDDPLHRHARIQLWRIAHPDPDSVLKNGGFESGSLDGWTVDQGVAEAIEGDAAYGQYAVQRKGSVSLILSQAVPVREGQVYLLTTRGKQAGTIPENVMVPCASLAEFYEGESRVWDVHSTRHTPNTALTEENGWFDWRSVLEVPAAAGTLVIKLRLNGPLLLDGVRLRKIYDPGSTEHRVEQTDSPPPREKENFLIPGLDE
jgi:hypothetical protein